MANTPVLVSCGMLREWTPKGAPLRQDIGHCSCCCFVKRSCVHSSSSREPRLWYSWCHHGQRISGEEGHRNEERKKNNKHKGLWRDTPWFVSRLSRGHVPSVPSSVPSVPRTFCPLNVNFHINRPKRPGCPWDVPNLSPGRSWGIPTARFLYVIFLYRFLFCIRKQAFCGPEWPVGVSPPPSEKHLSPPPLRRSI